MTYGWRCWLRDAPKLYRNRTARTPRDFTSGKGSEPGIPTASSRAIKDAIEDAYGRKSTNQL